MNTSMLESASYVDNKTVVEEERNGYASQFLVTHKTSIKDPEVKASIIHLSVDEIIS